MTPQQRIAAIQEIVSEGQYAKVDRVTVDLTTAAAILAVYLALPNAAARERYAAMPAGKMARLAFKVLR